MMLRVNAAQEQHGTAGHLRMYTLTLDQKPWESAEHAYDAIRRTQRVNKLCTWLRLKHGPGSMTAWVLEWQGNGWPHWHVLVWAPSRRYVHKHAAENAWGAGILRYTDPARGSKVTGHRHAVNYVTTYLSQGKHPCPEWVLDRSYVRHMGSCKTWGPIVGLDTPTDDQGEDDGSAQRAPARPNRVAIASCCSSVRLVETVVSHATGEVRRNYLGRVPVGIRTLRAMVGKLTRDGPDQRIGHAALQLGPGWHETTLGRALMGMMIPE